MKSLTWTCPQCGERVDDNFGSCWNCQTDRPENAELSEAQVEDIHLSGVARVEPVACLRCAAELEFRGTKSFHEGTPFESWLWGIFVNRERLDVYACPRCGRVEFFVAGGAA
jgi:predicted RNA-binding Zn-ribbon protein involved in translation (DUF1610 family)